MRRLGRRLRPVACDGGVSLMEMVIAMGLFSLVMAITVQVTVAVHRQTRDVDKSAAAVSQVRFALAEIDKQVRSGNVLYSPAIEASELASCEVSGTSGTCMRVYTQTNGAQRCVQWQVLPDPQVPGTRHLRSRSWAITWATDNNYSAWKTIARGLDNTPASMAFTLQGGVTAYKSRLLDVHLEAVDERRPENPVVIEASLAGRNTSYGYDAGLCRPAPPA